MKKIRHQLFFFLQIICFFALKVSHICFATSGIAGLQCELGDFREEFVWEMILSSDQIFWPIFRPYFATLLPEKLNTFPLYPLRGFVSGYRFPSYNLNFPICCRKSVLIYNFLKNNSQNNRTYQRSWRFFQTGRLIHVSFDHITYILTQHKLKFIYSVRYTIETIQTRVNNFFDVRIRKRDVKLFWKENQAKASYRRNFNCIPN